MKRPLTIALIIALLLPVKFSALGQNSSINYDLSSYQLPELKRHQLEVHFDFDQNRSYQNYRTNSDTLHTHSTDLSLNLNPIYIYYLNTKRLQFESYTSFNPFDFSYSRRYEESIKTKEQTFDSYLIHNGNYRFYLRGKFFVEADITSEIEMNLDNNKETENRVNSYSSYANIPLKVGVGRIERVEDARLAVYMLDDLKKHNRLDKEPTQEEITALAQFLSKLQNERFFDTREKKIWALQQIDSFMLANNLVKQNDVLSIALINDNWDYADGPVRESGFRISGGIINGYSKNNYSYKFDNSDNNYKPKNFQYNIRLTAEVDYEKPINLYWQFSLKDQLEAGPYFSFSNSDQYDNDVKTKSRTVRFTNYFFSGVGYYPTSRTEITMGLDLSTSYSKYNDLSEDALSESDESNNFNFSGGLSLEGYYYFSRQLQLNLNSGFTHNFTNQIFENTPEDDKYRHNSGGFYFKLGFTYKIL
jgi:hypothetical protein